MHDALGSAVGGPVHESPLCTDVSVTSRETTASDITCYSTTLLNYTFLMKKEILGLETIGKTGHLLQETHDLEMNKL